MSNTQFSCCHLLFQLFLDRMHNFPNLINFDFLALFWKDGLLLKTETSSFWKQATTNSIQDDKQFPFQATTRQQLVNKQHQQAFRQHAQQGEHHHLTPHLVLQRRRLPSEGFLFYFISPTLFYFFLNRRPTSMKGAQTRNFVWALALGRCFLQQFLFLWTNIY